MAQAVERRSRLLTLSSLLARTLRAAAAALERAGTAESRAADPLEATLARLRQRYPDAPEHWLRFVAERVPAGSAAETDARRAANRRGREAPAAAQAPFPAAQVTVPNAGAEPSGDSAAFKAAGADAGRMPPARRSSPLHAFESTSDAPALIDTRIDAGPVQANANAVRRAGLPLSVATPDVRKVAVTFAPVQASRAAAPRTAASFALPRPRFHRQAPPTETSNSFSTPYPPARPPQAAQLEDASRKVEENVERTDERIDERSVERNVHAPNAGRARQPAANANPPVEARRPAAPAQVPRPGARGTAHAAAARATSAGTVASRRAAGTTHASVVHAAPSSSSAQRSRFRHAPAQIEASPESERRPVFAPMEPQWPELPAPLGSEAPERLPLAQRPPEEPERWNALPF